MQPLQRPGKAMPPMRERAETLFREMDDGLYKLREAGASHQTQEKYGVGLIESTLRAVVAAERERCAKIVPLDWRNPLLTGPQAAIGNPPYDLRDIETLLHAIHDAIKQEDA